MKTRKEHLRYQCHGAKLRAFEKSDLASIAIALTQRNVVLGREIPNVTPAIEVLCSSTT